MTNHVIAITKLRFIKDPSVHHQCQKMLLWALLEKGPQGEAFTYQCNKQSGREGGGCSQRIPGVDVEKLTGC